MKVLVLTTDAYGASGGIALYNRDLIEALAKRDEVENVVVVPRVVRFDTGALPARVRLVATAAQGKGAWLVAAAACLAERFDLVICGHINLLATAAALNLRWRAPLVLLVYGIDVWQPHPSRFARAALRRVDAVWSISAITRDRMTGWSGIDPACVALLPNAIRLERYGHGAYRADLVERYGLEDRQVMLTLARLNSDERYKGIDETLEALPELLALRPRLRYVIAGDGNDRQRLEAKTRSLGIADQVVFTGFVPEQDKADMYRLADVFVMPGRGEGFGFVFLEALACGVPAVGSCIDGSREALREGELGELVDPGSREQLVAAILRSLDKPHEVPRGLSYFAWPAFQRRVGEATQAVMSSGNH